MDETRTVNGRRAGNRYSLVRGIALTLLLAGGLAPVGDSHGQGKSAAEPQTLDDLFGAPPPARPAAPPAKAQKAAPKVAPKAAEPASIDNLFGGPPTPAPAPQPAQTPSGMPPKAAQAPAQPAEAASPARQTRVSGFYQNELAYAYPRQENWSKFKNTLDLTVTGQTSGGVAWTLGGRLVYDPIYDLTDHYNSAVRDDQRLEASIREAYIDLSQGDWDFRLGRQHIIWGEMVALFVADVVSAKDLRELALQEFDLLRIPQWAARAEYFRGDFHGEAVWIPYMTYNNIGKPGAEFYPFTPPPGVTIAAEDRPVGIEDSGYGLRLSYLHSGWDVSGFYYSANELSPSYARLSPTLYQPIHERIHQFGATLGKDLGPVVLKAEAVYSMDKLFSVTRPSDADGLVEQDLLDYIVGLEWSFPRETRLNVQYYQRWFPDYDADIPGDASDYGLTLLFSTQALHSKIEPKVLLVRSLNRDSAQAQFKLTWRMSGNWRATLGANIFEGEADSVFGQYDSKDRVYTELRYTF